MVEIKNAKEVWVNGTRVGFISDNNRFYPLPGTRLYAGQLIEIGNEMAAPTVTPRIVDQATIDREMEQAKGRLQRQAPCMSDDFDDHISRSLHPEGD